MKITATLTLLLTFCSAFCQTFDVRKTSWGMTVSQVKESESPLSPTKEESSYDKTRWVVEYDGVIINDINTTIAYEFENGKLTQVNYRFNKTWQAKDMNLQTKVYYTQFVYNALVVDKGIKATHCWNYGLKSYSQYTGKYNCDYKSNELVSDVEAVGLRNGHDEVSCHFNNQRTYARIQYRLKDNDPIFKGIIAWVQISAFGDTEKKMQGTGF